MATNGPVKKIIARRKSETITFFILNAAVYKIAAKKLPTNPSIAYVKDEIHRGHFPVE